MIDSKSVLSIARNEWGDDKILKTTVIALATVSVVICACALVIPNDPKENE